ncbi:MAG: hypothetical protein AMS20_12700, partial [Gemmatimonas sp. SG8_28]
MTRRAEPTAPTEERAMPHTLRRAPLSLLLALPFLTTCGGRAPEIDQASVTRILTTLSADEMEGRRAFTPAATKAAEFIHAEFAAIGLEHFDDLRDYLQDFAVYAVAI